MIAICIPVYNFDVRQLINELKQQMLLEAEIFELIVIDDASQLSFKETNKGAMLGVRYIELESNVGRSAIRNKFLELTESTYLLFLDCDAIAHQPNFLKTYRDFIFESDASIVCGGRVYPDECPSSRQQLRWKYGWERESLSAEVRQAVPNRSFMTNNFLVKRTVLETIRFDESLTGYGHEDTLFGIELEKQGISVVHIENPILNGDIETNEVFLKKTVQGVQNLARIYEMSDAADRQLLADRVTLLSLYRKTRFMHVIIRLIFKMVRASIEQRLTLKGQSLLLFQCYKFGILLTSLRL
jgi:glycosyltransferase involved in cell wall biosynthesis